MYKYFLKTRQRNCRRKSLLNQAGQNRRDSSLKGCSFPPDKTWLTKISQHWIIHILGYVEQNLKHATDLSLLSSILLSKLSSSVGIYKKYAYNFIYNLNLIRNCSWTSFPHPEVSMGGLILLVSSWKRGVLPNGWVWEKKLRSVCLVLNLFFEKVYVSTAPWTWVYSRQPSPGRGQAFASSSQAYVGKRLTWDEVFGGPLWLHS